MTSTSVPSSSPSAPGLRVRSAAIWRASLAWLGRHRGAATVIVLLVGVPLAWSAVRSLWAPPAVDAPTIFNVQRRSFMVNLLQKGELRAVKSVDLRSEIEGRATVIRLIPEGTEVKQGDLLVELASNEIDERVRSEEITVAKGEAALQAAEKEYEIQVDQNASDIRKGELAVRDADDALHKYLEGDWVQKNLEADLEIQQADEEKRQANSKYEDSKELYNKKFITKNEYERDSFSLLVADIAVKKANLAKEILHKYTHPTAMRGFESDLGEAEKDLARVSKSAAAKETQKRVDMESRRAEAEIARQRLAKYKDQKSKTQILAPGPGLVVYYSEEGRHGGETDQVKEGAEVRERQPLITLPDTSQMKVVVRIHEATAGKVAPGQLANVTVEGISDRSFAGKVTSVAPLADSQNRWLNPDLKEYETEITLDGSDLALKPGVTARAEIHVENVADVLAVPVQTVFTKGGKHFVFRQRLGRAKPVEVRLGSSNEEYVAVTDGLAVGDKILLAVADDLKRELPDVQTSEENGGPIAPIPIPVPAAGQRPPGSGPPGGGPGGERPRMRSRPGESGPRSGDSGARTEDSGQSRPDSGRAEGGGRRPRPDASGPRSRESEPRTQPSMPTTQNSERKGGEASSATE